MEPILLVGVVVFTGSVFGEVCTRVGLPKVTGYILAGLILNPNATHFIPNSFIEHTDFITDIALSFITFSVGGTLSFSKIRSQGKSILCITFFEAECAFLFVAIFFILLGPIAISQPKLSLVSFFIPLALLLASLASPTDPSATLAVEHEYHAQGEVTSTIMEVAAFDDIIGIINYSLATSIASICLLHQPLEVYSITLPFIKIFGSIIGGSLFGFCLNILTKIIKKEPEGVLIALIISVLSLCYGLAGIFGADELLSTMTMGIIVSNYNTEKEKIFKILERYTEELIFIFFFTISAMQLDFSILVSNYPLIIIFIAFRSIGKFIGTFVGGRISKSSLSVQKFTVGGLIPQGGIVIGLALLLKQNAIFDPISDIILNVIIGATIVHEILGPIISKFALEKAGEITLIKKNR